jgi:hypothetical protein
MTKLPKRPRAKRVADITTGEVTDKEESPQRFGAPE